jgi:membrane fusion protein (multidrug efflux system)
LRPGQYSRIRAATRIDKDALLVPQRAVHELQGEYELAVVDGDNRVALRNVKASNRVGSYWIIEQGLSADDRVVIEGLQKIKTGERVKPKDAQLPPLTSALTDVRGSAP